MVHGEITDIYRPRPKKPYTSLADAMGLSRKSLTFKRFTILLRKLAKKHLDLHLNVFEQTSEQWQKFLHEAYKQCELVDDYEDAWPIEAHMQTYLGATSYHYRMQMKQAASNAPQYFPRRSARIDEPSRLKRHQISTHTTLDRPQWSTSEPQPPASAQNVTLPSSAMRTPSGSVPRFESSSRTSCAERPVVMITSKPPSAGLLAVEAFLRSLEPAMEGLAVRFVAAGIFDAGCLRGLARMEEKDRRMFLNDILLLNPLQLVVIRAALSKLV